MIAEIKQAMAICEKYNISIYERGKNPFSAVEDKVTVEMYDSDTFFAMDCDYYNFACTPYCANAGDTCTYVDCDDCKFKEMVQPFVKRAGGVWFYCVVPFDEEFNAAQRPLMKGSAQNDD